MEGSAHVTNFLTVNSSE